MKTTNLTLEPTTTLDYLFFWSGGGGGLIERDAWLDISGGRWATAGKEIFMILIKILFVLGTHKGCKMTDNVWHPALVFLSEAVDVYASVCRAVK